MNAQPIIENAEPVYVQIARFLRTQIIEGKLESSKRLFTTQELARQWGVGHTTIQRAMARLTAEGLLNRTRRGGTFVKSEQSQAVIGVLIGSRLTDESSYFHRVMLESIRSEVALLKDFQWTCRAYDGLTEQLWQPDFQQSPVCRQFASDFQNHPFKGLVQMVTELKDLRTLKPGLNLPVARLGQCWETTGVDVVLDYGDFTRETVKRLAQRGAKRLVYLRTVSRLAETAPDLQGLFQAASAAGLARPEVCQMPPRAAGVQLPDQLAYEETLRLIDQWKQNGQCPDALIVSDDFAARGTTLALVSRGLHTDGRLLVATIGNEGLQHPYGMPVIQYQFNHRAVAGALLQILWKRILGQALPSLPVKISGCLACSSDRDCAPDSNLN
ncbi:MAG: GntR family transcriptional regulator [Verrucomicrobiae bacterium]|nr:GntR family transcriptional regulator [Verrucomicrobiae bacterium]